MPSELFADNAVTSLSSSPAIGATSFTVASSSGFPAAVTGVSQFRVIIDTEIVTVTNVSGTTWTCAALAAAHSAAVPVTHVITAAALGNHVDTKIAAQAATDSAANLSNLASATTARTNLGLGTAATHATTDYDAAGAATAAVAPMVPRWAPTMAYTLGQQVVSPGNDVVSAIAGHTSGSTFTPANWTLSSTYVPHRASLRYDPAGKADGAIGGTADTGQPFTTFTAPGHTELPVIAAGVIAHTPYAGAVSAGYLQASLGARVRRIGAMISWPLNALGVAAFVIPSAPWASGTLPNAGFHLTINGNGIWTLSRWAGGAATTLASYVTHGRFATVWGAGPQPFDFWIDTDNSRAVLCWPDGSRSIVTSAYFNTETANYGIWELFENDGVTDVPVTFGAIWADSGPLGPDAGPSPYRAAVDSPNAPPGALTANGAVTLDLSLAQIHQLTLNGNITALTFTNPKGGQQEFEIHFMQDGTGSRTLAGAAAAIKWAGGVAPVLSTGANRRDVFRFRYLGAVFVEIGRSMNVNIF